MYVHVFTFLFVIRLLLKNTYVVDDVQVQFCKSSSRTKQVHVDDVFAFDHRWSVIG